MTKTFAWLALLPALLLAVPGLAHAEETLRCPDTLKIDSKDHALGEISLYDGPPEQMADLVPDYNGWNLLDYRTEERELYLVCHYAGTKKTQKFLVPRSMSACHLDKKNVVCR
jgi:hypothetical protein